MDTKPSFANYKKQSNYIFRKGAYIESNGHRYTLGDRWLVFAGYLLLLILLQVGILSNPYYVKHLYWWLFFGAVIILFGVLMWLYMRFYIYHFGWFHVHKDLPSNVPEYLLEYMPAEYEDEKTDVRRQEKRKSRLYFAALLLVIIVFGVLFRLLTFGLAHQRLLNNHMQELDQLTLIAQKYESINMAGMRPEPQDLNGSVHDETGYFTLLTADDADDIRTILADLNGHYINAMTVSDGHMSIWLTGGFSFKRLVWSPNKMSTDEAMCSFDTKAVRLDDHWWCVW